MFIECNSGSYFNTDQAVGYGVVVRGGKHCVMAMDTSSDSFVLAQYDTKQMAQRELKNIILWIRSMQGMEPSDPRFMARFIYQMPKIGSAETEKRDMFPNGEGRGCERLEPMNALEDAWRVLDG